MSTIKKIFKDSKVWMLLICLLLGLVAIHPAPWNSGVAIKGIAKNSSAELAGFEPPKAKTTPTSLERIIAINNKPITTLEDYYTIVSKLGPNQSVRVKTTKDTKTLVTKPIVHITVLNETETIEINETREVNETTTQTINGTNTTTTHLVNKTTTKEIEQNKTITEIIGTEPLGFTISEAPTSNLRKGLDLQGGARIVLRPEASATPEMLDETVSTLEQRLNVYGLSDIVITQISDNPDILGGGTHYILIEAAGATEEELLRLVNATGKFEGKIANHTVFRGGTQDITYVCRAAQCAGLDPNVGCGKSKSSNGYGCQFRFQITLSPQAAGRFADLTRDLTLSGKYLSEPLILYLDDQEVDKLNVAADLRGRASTDIVISGGGSGNSMQSATQNSLDGMKRLQTILKTGSLPLKLSVDRVDAISPALGKEFLTNAFFVGILSLIGVTIILIIAYRKFIIALPIMFTALSEIFLTLSVAALIGWNIDLAAIAGIILSVGTGVNDQIIMTDEAIKKETDETSSWKDRIKKAFFIIFSSSATTFVAMIPLLFAGAGLLKGFAITTMLAIAVGIFITRPAYAAVVHLLLEQK